jgi:hypothetical protein
MRRIRLTVVLAAALAGCGGSNNASDPVDACKNVFSTLCNKLFQCNPTEAAQAYGNTSSCASTLSASCSAANTSCPSGTSYNAGNASSCINDYSNQSCTDVMAGTTPQSCLHVCQ